MSTAVLTRDPVFTALTRPQMFAGVTYSYFIMNAVVTVELFLLTKSFWALLAAVLLHGAGNLACQREPRLFDMWLIRAKTCPPVRNARFWRCNTYAA